MFGRIHLWERLAWLGATVGLLLTTFVTAGVSGSRVARAVEQRQAALAEAGQLRAALQKVRAEAQPEAAPGAEVSAPVAAAPQLDGTGVSAELRERLIADLQEHPELIPHSGVLGGTMGFHDPHGIHILGTRWVLADFEDGHIDGRALLAYRVRPGGGIDWRLLDSYLNE